MGAEGLKHTHESSMDKRIVYGIEKTTLQSRSYQVTPIQFHNLVIAFPL